eukprot:gnl/Carplike_NY0171/2653_a3566_583.p1 GENE.gnl/Carplike_NY0171/2653_a3566_583~~gnl/Carplike_NY0171/2653_a3566_583.p1  ORF type:complete len:187 (+),score=13.32 gnl/Carplike_NY0171/2653_a3566_583:42-602(+)
MKVMKRKILGITVIAAVLISVVAYAQKGEPRKKFPQKDEMQMRPDFGPRGQENHFFTEEQQETIKKIRLETAKEIKPLRNKLQEMEARQHTLTTAENADMNAIYKNIEEIAGVKTEIAKIQAEKHQEVRKLLTDEQLIKFDNFRERRFGKEMGRPGPGMDRQMDGPMDRNMDRAERTDRPPFEEGE